MSDLETGMSSKGRAAATAYEIPPTPPPLEHRETTFFSAFENPDDVAKKVYKSNLLRFAFHIIFPFAAVVAVPLALFDTVAKHSMVHGVRVFNIFVWIEVIILGLWVCKISANIVPRISQFFGGNFSAGFDKYSRVIQNLETPVCLFLWSIVSWATVEPVLYMHTEVRGLKWIYYFHRALLAVIVVAGIFLLEKLAVQVLAMQYHRRQWASKTREEKKIIRIFDLLVDPTGKGDELIPTFPGDTSCNGRQTALAEYARKNNLITTRLMRWTNYVSGKRGNSTTLAHQMVKSLLSTEKGAARLVSAIWKSFDLNPEDSFTLKDIEKIIVDSGLDVERYPAKEIFEVLDQDGNGDVNAEEMTQLVTDLVRARILRTKSMHDIDQAIKVLDRLLSALVLVIAAVVFAAFFSTSFTSHLTTLWSTFTGLSFAIGGTVTEFLGSCIFLFVKHPFDRGDRVEISGTTLIVEHISLMYTLFRRVDNEKLVQIPHTVSNGLWIENTTRSKNLKERIVFTVSSETNEADLSALRLELSKFLAGPDNRRDFKSDFSITLASLSDMGKLELRFEVHHKSGWSDARICARRRNSLLTAIMAILRHCHIYDATNGDVGAGASGNPAYYVTVSDEEAARARAEHSAAREKARAEARGVVQPQFTNNVFASAFEAHDTIGGSAVQQTAAARALSGSATDEITPATGLLSSSGKTYGSTQ